ncbi:hypothetical protein KIL84_006386 [Mauremys mutica]|uniref:Uncharacterized protein n=1 Tax=Mauremys mutica TaxID=74926 RepID=A0A9D3X0M5_9SAUR|nr:hypothetical protein KIL84_006386 [Mauremys mutica]
MQEPGVWNIKATQMPILVIKKLFLTKCSWIQTLVIKFSSFLDLSVTPQYQRTGMACTTLKTSQFPEKGPPLDTPQPSQEGVVWGRGDIGSGSVSLSLSYPELASLLQTTLTSGTRSCSRSWRPTT